MFMCAHETSLVGTERAGGAGDASLTIGRTYDGEETRDGGELYGPFDILLLAT